MKVLAGIVTHNRCELLARCVDALQSQSRAVDEVLVVNNASTDGTVEMLMQRGINTLTQGNTGSAGGWKRCIEYALANAFDAVWLMDDDGYPDAKALSQLVLHLEDGDVACASSVVIRETDRERFVFPFPKLARNGLPVLFSCPRKIDTLDLLRRTSKQGVYPFAHLFNGALISLKAVNNVGNVNSEFFMFGDEVDYFFRLKKFGKVISVLDAVHFHPDVSRRPYTPAKVYYYLKNTLILNRRYFDYVLLRHVMAITIVLWRTGMRNGWGMVTSLIFGPMSGGFYRAIKKGLAGKLGKDFES